MKGLSEIVRMSACVLLLSLATLGPEVFAQPVATDANRATQVPFSQPSPTVDPEQVRLQKERLQLERDKLQLEIDKLRIENLNNVRDPNTGRGWWNLIFLNLTFVTTVALVAGGLVSYFQKRSAELRSREEERFEGVVRSLGSERVEERISAAVLLSTFLSPQYARFHEQVFNLAAGHLRSVTNDQYAVSRVAKVELPTTLARVDPTLEIPCEMPMSSSISKVVCVQPSEVSQEPIMLNRDLNVVQPDPSPLAQSLANVLTKSYSMARDARRKKVGSDPTVFTSQYLNAASVQLDGTYLANADLRNAWLREADLRDTTLRSALLTNAVLEGSQLSRANLTEAELNGANLKDVDFSGADLSSAGLDGSNLDGANFKDARLQGVRMIGGTAAGVNFTNADLSDARFIGIDFSPTDQFYNPSNLDRAASLKNAVFKNVKGLSDELIARCTAKGAFFENDSTEVTSDEIGPTDSLQSDIDELVRKIKYYPEVKARLLAADKLALLDTPLESAVQEIASLLAHPNRDDRLVGIRALGKLRERARNVVPQIIEFLNDPDKELRNASIETIADIGVLAVPPLLEMLSHEDADVRSSVVDVFGRIGEPASDAIFHLISLLSDPSPLVRNSAAAALGNMGKRAKLAVPGLAGALNDSDRSVRRNAADSLGRIGDDAKDALPNLIEALDDSDSGTREHAAKAIGHFRDYGKEAVPYLIKAFSDSDEKIRKSAANALASIGEVASSQLMNALNSPLEEVRMNAAKLLAIITKQSEKDG